MELENDITYSTYLVLIGDELDPEEMTDLLDVEPDNCWRKGDVKSLYGIQGKPLAWGGWKKAPASSYRDSDLEEQLEYWCDFIQEKRDVFRQIQRDGIAVSIDCSIETSDVSFLQLQPQLSLKLAELKVCLDISFVALESEPENQEVECEH